MKTQFTLLGIIFLAFTTLAQVKEERPLSNFTAIEVTGIGDVILTTGDYHVEVEASKNDLKKIKSEIIDGKLHIYPSKTTDSKDVKFYISAPNIAKIKLSGVATLTSIDTIKTDNLIINVRGAGGIDIKVDCNNLKTTILGAGDVKIRGKAIVHEINVSGAGDLLAFDLLTEVTNAKISGAGDVHISAQEEVNVKVSGAGDVFLEGEPKKKNIEVAGAGDIYSYHSDSTNADTIKLKFRDNKFWIITNGDDWEECDSCYKSNKYWAGFDVGVNGFVTPSGSVTPPLAYDFLELNYAKSIVMNLNLLEKGMNIYDEYFKIVTGLGFEFNKYYFDNNITLMPNQNSITGFTDTSRIYRKNKLNTTFVNVPLLLAFSTNKNPDKAFHFCAGVVGGYRIGTKYKQKYVQGSEDFSNTIKSNFNLSPFRVSARASLGYNNFNLYASYSLTEMFQKGEGPVLRPFSIGLQIVPF